LALKRDAEDAAISDLIREAADYVCEYCGIEVPRGNGRAFHCSHFFSRANRQVRHHPDNLMALCAGCHKKLGESPHLHVAAKKRQLGETRYEELCRRAHGTAFKYMASDKKERLAHYRAELQRIRKLRKHGVTGRIEVVSYD